MAVQPVGQLGVDLIGQHHDVGAAQHLRDGLQIGRAHHAAGGVVGEGQHQQLGFGGDGRFQLVGGEAEILLRFGGDMHRHAAGELGDGFVADKARLRDDDLIPRLHQRTDAQVDGLAAAHRHHHLIRLVIQLEPAGQITANFLTQLHQACVGGVFGAPLLQTADARVTHRPGGLEVRLAHAQTDAMGHFRRHIEKPANARGPHLLGGGGQNGIVVHHRTVHSLSSISSA